MSIEINLFQIEIPKRAAQCSLGNEPLIADMEYYSILVPQENEYQRQDFCLSCWENQAKDQYAHAVKTAWKAKVVSKKEVEDLSVKTRDEKAFYLLKEKLRNFQEEEWAEIFVLALYLARRRILYLRQELPQDGFTLCIYEVAATEEMWSIKRKSLIGVDIEEVQLKIAEKLKK